MAWMKLDDKFHSSRKVNSIPKRHRFQAVGLWALAGSWVAGEETDGFVPDYMIAQWGPTDITVQSLVNAGLWERVRDGFVFCSWLEYNPSKAQTKAEREASAQRMKASRDRKKSKAAGPKADDVNVAAQQVEPLQRNTSDVLQRPDPTRPDPTPNNNPPTPRGRPVRAARPDAPEDEPTHLPALVHDDGAPTPAGIVREWEKASGSPLTDSTRAAMRLAVNQCLRAGHQPATIHQGLTDWAGSKITATSQIPAFIDRAAVKPQLTPTTPSKSRRWADIGRNAAQALADQGAHNDPPALTQ